MLILLKDMSIQGLCGYGFWLKRISLIIWKEYGNAKKKSLIQQATTHVCLFLCSRKRKKSHVQFNIEFLFLMNEFSQ